MKNFRAIYNTSVLNNVKYDFQAKSVEDANLFCEGKFNMNAVSNFKLIEIK